MNNLILYAVAALLLAGVLWKVNDWREDSAQLAIERVQWHDALAAKDKRIAQEIDNARKANESSDDYQKRLHALEDQRLEPFPSVRLCKQPTSAARVSASATASGSDAAATADIVKEAEGHSEPGPDIGPALLEYGLQCEANALQLDRLQEWIRHR
jgi:hypothetical protein